MIRIGIGYDMHRLEKGVSLILGGVSIPYEKGSVGHSDGDPLIHAVVDAILGAMNKGDIGHFFPSTNNKWKGASSLLFLNKCASELKHTGFSIINIDSTIILQAPAIGEYIPTMKTRIAESLKIDEDQISIKATTTDFLGSVGRGEGVAAQAVVTITNSEL